MTKKVYTFYDESWHDEGIGCDCCQGGWYELWNCNDIQYSTTSMEDSYIAAISDITKMSYDAEDVLRELSLDELKELADVFEIDVVFVE